MTRDGARPGILAIWNDCAPEGRADYERWYMAQHLPERVTVPGFRFGRRYQAIEATSQYFTYYETDSAAVLASPPYLERLENPTPWTRRVMPHFRDTSRTICRLAASVGSMQGSHVLAIHASAPAAPGAEFEDSVAGTILPNLEETADVCRGQFWIAAPGEAPAAVAEAEMRGQPDRQIAWALVVETSRPESARALAADGSLPEALTKAGAGPEISRGLYRLLCFL
ncbi:MAG: hypothetical protein QF578_11010 [Alphaproteobacteria bacterium]|nr:hypothetical protein [Alphaproteobacteria bacterium]